MSFELNELDINFFSLAATLSKFVYRWDVLAREIRRNTSERFFVIQVFGANQSTTYFFLCSVWPVFQWKRRTDDTLAAKEGAQGRIQPGCTCTPVVSEYMFIVCSMLEAPWMFRQQNQGGTHFKLQKLKCTSVNFKLQNVNLKIPPRMYTTKCWVHPDTYTSEIRVHLEC